MADLAAKRGNRMEEQPPRTSKAFGPTQTTLLLEVYTNHMDKSTHGQRIGKRLEERNQGPQIVRIYSDPKSQGPKATPRSLEEP